MLANAAAPTTPPALLTAQQLARHLGIKVRTFKAWLSSGQFPSADVSLGAKYRRWTWATLQSWIDQHSRDVVSTDRNLLAIGHLSAVQFAACNTDRSVHA
jgi:predicted DNA-binding transcriptional regulator AlpA